MSTLTWVIALFASALVVGCASYPLVLMGHRKRFLALEISTIAAVAVWLFIVTTPHLLGNLRIEPPSVVMENLIKVMVFSLWVGITAALFLLGQVISRVIVAAVSANAESHAE